MKGNTSRLSKSNLLKLVMTESFTNKKYSPALFLYTRKVYHIKLVRFCFPKFSFQKFLSVYSRNCCSVLYKNTWTDTVQITLYK